MLFGILVVLYVIVCLFLCLLVLIQSDKGGGVSGTLGGGFAGASSLLGAQDTANILTRGTTIFASAYMVLCIVISLIIAHGASSRVVDKSALKERAEKQGQYAPASIFQKPIGAEGEAGGATVLGEQLPMEPLDAGKAGAGAPAAGENAPAPAE